MKIDWMYVKELIDGGSNHIVQLEFGITFVQSTAERYLDQLTSVTGPLVATGYKDVHNVNNLEERKMKIDWMYVQNIVIIIAIAVIWIYTGSPWSLVAILGLMSRSKD